MRITLQLGSAVPDRDFVLRWQELPTESAAGNAWICTEEADTWGLVQVKAPEHASGAEQYQQDVYFLVDRSGSMEGEKWMKTAEALKSFVRQLGKLDRVWITFFESNFADFAEEPWPAPKLLSDRNFLSVEKRGTGGGTEMLPALEHVLEMASRFSFDQKRRAVLVLITDGEIGNEEAVLAALRPYPSLRVHAFGIDVTVNDALLRQLARQQHGSVTLQTPADDVARAVSSLGAKLRRPVLTNFELGAGWQSASDYLPDLYASDVVSLPLRRMQARAELKISGRLPDGSVHTLALQPRQTANPALRLLWMRDHIQHLLGQNKAEAIRLAIETNLICDGTAFIAWDREEKVPVAVATLYQPALEAGEVRFSLVDLNEPQYIGTAPTYRLAERIRSILTTRKGQRFVDALWRWASADPALVQQREELTIDFLAAVEAELGRDRQKRLCVKFVEDHILQPRFEESLRIFFDNLRQTHADLDSCRDVCKKFLRDLQADPAYELLELARKL